MSVYSAESPVENVSSHSDQHLAEERDNGESTVQRVYMEMVQCKAKIECDIY